MDIFQKINSNIHNINEENVDEWVLPLLDYYSSKISFLSRIVYGNSKLGKSAFVELSAEKLRNGLFAFVNKRHWVTGRELNPYLQKCLKNLARQLRNDIDARYKANVPICPACKEFGEKEFLFNYDKKLHCQNCAKELSRLQHSKKANKNELKKVNLSKIFVTHSRLGKRCPECSKFIPNSYITSNTSCPYDDCMWFGSSSELTPMSHPVSTCNKSLFSLDRPITPESNSSFRTFLDARSINADVSIQVKEQFYSEFDVLKTVIEAQKKRAEREGARKSIKKVLMYQAYLNLLEEQPEDMVSYLVHQKSCGELPIQSQIFQEFIRLVESNLPFEITKGGKTVEVFSLLDKGLDLFLGVSEFESVVKGDGIIKNKTKEIYIGGREGRDFGPCFIGLLCDITDESGVSLKDNVEHYTFANIKVNDKIKPGTKVCVKHYRIPSHYELNGLVYLQRIRRKIVDSVYKRLNGEERPVG